MRNASKILLKLAKKAAAIEREMSPYKCPYCRARFKLADSLARHEYGMHRKELNKKARIKAANELANFDPPPLLGSSSGEHGRH